MGKGIFKIPVTDPESGRVYQIPWSGDKEPTKWDLQAVLKDIKDKESFSHPKLRTGNPFQSLFPEIEIGNKLAERADKEAAKPIYKWQNRPLSIGPDKGRIPILSSVAGWFRQHAPSEVEDFKAFTERPKAVVAGFTGNMASDMMSPASIAFNLVGMRGAQQWMKGAVAANRARKTVKTAEKLITPEVVEILRTAPQGSPEWLKAANKSLRAIGVDAFPGISLDADIKLVPHNLSGIRRAEKAAKEAEKAGGKIKGRKPKQLVLKQAELGPLTSEAESGQFNLFGPRQSKSAIAEAEKKLNLFDQATVDKLKGIKPPEFGPAKNAVQSELDLTGKAIPNGPGVGPDTRHIRAYTVKLNNKDVDFTRDILPMLQSYVDRRGSGDMVREMVGRRFAPLKEQGMQAILDYNAGKREGLLAEVEKMLNKDFLDRRITGDKSKYKWNYLTQMWDNTPEEIQAVFGLKNPPKKMNIAGGEFKRRAGINPDFLKQSFFQNYQAGMERGLKPKYDNIVDLLADYMTRSNKFQADKSNLNFLKANKLVAKEGSKLAKEKGYEFVEGLPTFRGKDGTIGHWVADPNVAKYLNNYFGSPHKAAKWVGDWSNLSKAIAMGAGIPKTILNAHGFNIAKAAWDMGGTRGLLDFATSGITERGARKGYEKIFSNPTNLQNLLDLTRHGYVGNIAEDFRNLGGKTGLEFGDKLRESKNLFKKSIGWMEGQLSKNVEKPLFGYKLPATKAREALIRLDDLIAEGLPREKALRIAADEANTGFGGMNYIRNYNPTQLNPLRSGGMDRNVDQVMRGIFLAPDWTGRNLKMGKKVYGSLFDKNPNPVYARIATQNAMLRNAVRAQTANQLEQEDITDQRATEGTLAPIGTVDDGDRRRELNLFGTSTEWLRMPNQALMGFGQGDVPQINKMFQNRFNPLTRNAVSLFFNQDYNENPIYSTDRWGNPIPMAQSIAQGAKYALAPFTHPIVSNAIDFGMGNIGPEQALAQSFELPFNYRYVRRGRGRTSNPFSVGNLWGQ